MPLKPHPKVPGPVRLVTAAISQVPRHATASQTAAASTAASAAGPGPASTRGPAAEGALGPVNDEAALEQGQKQRRRKVVFGLSEDEDEEQATLPVGAETRAVVMEEQEATSPAAAAARAGNLQPLSRRSRRRITRKPGKGASMASVSKFWTYVHIGCGAGARVWTHKPVHPCTVCGFHPHTNP